MTTSTVPRTAAVVAGAAILAAAFWLGSHTSQASAVTDPPSPSAASPTGTGITSTGITVTGESTAAGKPDTLRLDLSVSTKAGSVQGALREANDTMSKVQASLRSSGVADKDLQTSSLDIRPSYSSPERGTPTIDGYTVTEGVTALLRDLRKAGPAITDATKAGGNALQVNGIRLDIGDTSTLAKTARDRAVANAKTKAEQFAKATGRELGQVMSLTESVTKEPATDYGVSASAAKDSAVPIEAGSQDVAVKVTVVYAFR
jgi:uncharacterized protein YggE